MDILLFSVDVLTVMLDKRWLKGSCYLQVFYTYVELIFCYYSAQVCRKYLVSGVD